MKNTLLGKLGLCLIAAAITGLQPASAQVQVINAGNDTSVCLGSTVTLNATLVSGVPSNAQMYQGSSLVPLGDDNWSTAVPIPFPFTFFGNVFNQCVIGSNNVLSFDVAAHASTIALNYQYCTWPIGAPVPSVTPADMRNAIMGPWQDLLLPSGGTIRYATTGTAPNRVFVVEWCTVAYFSCTSINTSDQIWLYEGTNVIESHILNKPTCVGWNSGRGIRAIQNATGTVAYVVPGQNCCAAWTASNDGQRWTPTGPATYTLASIPFAWIPLANPTINWFANGSPVGTGPSITVTPTVTTSYIAQVTAPCSNAIFRDTVTVNITPLFTISFNPVVNVACFGGSTGAITVNASPSATLPLSYQWSTIPPQSTQTATSLNANTYTVTVTDAGGCMVTDTITITEPPDLIVTPDPPTNVSCAGAANGVASVTVSGGVAPYSYAWSNGGSSNPNTNLSGNTYTVTVSDANGCTKTASVTVTEPTQLVISPTASTTICIGSTVNLCPNESGGTPGYTYQWSNGSMTQCVIVGPTTTTLYTVTVTDANGCAITSSAIFITVNPPLAVTAVVDKPAICVGDSVQLTAVGISGGDGNYTYTWIPAIGSSATPAKHSPMITTNYIIILTDGCGTPPASDSVNVTVNPLPIALFSGTNLAGCVDLTSCFTDLSNLSSGTIAQWQWDFGDGSAGANTQNPCHTYMTPSSPNLYTVTLTVASAAGCSQSFTINNYVDAHPQTSAYFTMTPKFTTLAEPRITFEAIGGDTSWTYNWSFGDGYSETGKNTFHDYTEVDKYQVCLYTTNIYNCADTLCDSVDIRSDFAFYVPNVFTPNNDQVNEMFTPMGRSFQDYDLSIFDRWGNIIFRSRDIRFSWDGKLSSGEQAPAGVYVYVIDLRDLDGIKHQFIGNVALIR